MIRYILFGFSLNKMHHFDGEKSEIVAYRYSLPMARGFYSGGFCPGSIGLEPDSIATGDLYFIILSIFSP